MLVQYTLFCCVLVHNFAPLKYEFAKDWWFASLLGDYLILLVHFPTTVHVITYPTQSSKIAITPHTQSHKRILSSMEGGSD